MGTQGLVAVKSPVPTRTHLAWSPSPATHNHVILGVTSVLSGPQFRPRSEIGLGSEAGLGPRSSEVTPLGWDLPASGGAWKPSPTRSVCTALLPPLTLHCYLKWLWFGSLFF